MPDKTVVDRTEETERASLEAAGATANEAPGEALATTASPPALRFKGWRGGLLVELPDSGDWAEIVASLTERLAVARDFWDGAPATLALGERPLATADLDALLDRLRNEFGLEPAGIVSTVEAIRTFARERNLEVHDEIPRSRPKPEPPDPRDQTRYIKGTVRSGMVVESPGHLVIVGDVNAGAEIRAGGDIVVMGTLRGVAHAGFGGDLTAQILAINLRPTQLRIGDLIARSPDGGQPPLSKFPEKAVVEDGEIHVLPL